MLTRLIRRLNWARRGWSSTADRVYHDEVFKHAGYDPTDSAYPGSVTIRRFADLAARHISNGHIVVDLGCGPGEITCELARRFPVSRFIGVDHSATAIARAHALAQQTGLTNVTFTVEDLNSWVPAKSVDLVTMFDAFHHVPDPEATIARLGAHTHRFFLIEPAGNWYGGWEQSVNLDWVAESLFLIRDRLAAQLAPVAPTSPKPSTMPPPGEPVERRYPLEDFERMFAGYGLDVQGTTAGIERYGTQPEAITPLRRDVGDLTYRMFVELDVLLKAHDLDLGAKHWAIYAERGREYPRRLAPAPPAAHAPTTTPLAGPYDATYIALDTPVSVASGAPCHVQIEVTNRSWRTWSSEDVLPMYLSSRVVDRRGTVVIPDGPRAPWPRPVPPGTSCAVYLTVHLPAVPGRYTVHVDGVHEGVTWFSQAGVPPLLFSVAVTPP